MNSMTLSVTAIHNADIMAIDFLPLSKTTKSVAFGKGTQVVRLSLYVKTEQYSQLTSPSDVATSRFIEKREKNKQTRGGGYKLTLFSSKKALAEYLGFRVFIYFSH